MENNATIKTLEFNPHAEGIGAMKKLQAKQPHSLYKAALLVNDFLVSLLIFMVFALMFVDNIDLTSNFSHAVTIVLFAITAIAFFKPCKLYNYHIIYDRNVHIKQMAMAFGWNTLSLFFAFLIYNYASDMDDLRFVTIILGVAVLFMLLRRYIEDYSFQILIAMSISLLIVGCLGVLGVDPMTTIAKKPAMLLLGYLSAVALVSGSRYLMVHQLFSKVMKKSFRRQTIIIGPNDQAKVITQYVIDRNTPFWIAGFVTISSGYKDLLPMDKKKLGDLLQLPQILEKNHASEIIITDESIDKKNLVAILDYCAALRINVWFPPNYMPVIDIKLYIDNFCGIPMIRLGSQKNSWLFSKTKYALDAAVTLPIFILQLPFFLAIAAAVKLTSKGPVFYRATAIGKSGQQFTMFKFRSMREGSDQKVHKEYVTRMIKGELTNDGDSTKVLKLTNDERITSVGRIIRKYSLDELPQLINVLKGDMSLVGPRPCLPYEYEAYDDWHKKRTAIRPGISGLWQVTGRSEVSFEDMMLLDLYYVYNRNLLLDFSILIETIFVVLKKKGAY